MKLNELEKGKQYLVYNREHWIGAGYGQSYFKVANDLRRNRMTPLFNEDGTIQRDYSGRVYMVCPYGRIERVLLKNIRSEFWDAVALITKNNKKKHDPNQWRAQNYAKHLERKAERVKRDIERPIEERLIKALQELMPNRYVSMNTTLGALPIEVKQVIADALLKTGENK